MARAANPGAMQPHQPARTRTAPPVMPARFPMGGRYLVYTVFGACSLAFIFSSGILLRTVWAIGSGPEAFSRVMEDLRHPLYVGYHVLALVAFLYTGWRFFIKLFGKAQPPRIGPLKPPPVQLFPPMLLLVWLAASAAVLAVAWGIFP